MKNIVILVSLLMLFSIVSPQAYSAEYLADGWLKITRQMIVNEAQGCLGGGITGGCSATGAATPSAYTSGSNAALSTDVQLILTNVGPIERDGIEVSESLSHVPDGASVSYFPEPSAIVGRLATWQIASLKSGESRNVSYSYSAAAREGQISRIPPVQVKAEPAKVSLSAPAESQVGGSITVKLMSESGLPMAGTKVRVNYPDGTAQLVSTDKNGTASFTALREGFFTYSVDGYSLLRLASTEVRPGQADVPVLAAAAVYDPGILSSITSLLPILAGIFAVAVVMLIAYNFFSVKREDDLSGYAQPAAQQGASPSDQQKPVSNISAQYSSSPLSVSQNYSFSGTAGDSKKSPVEAAKDEKSIDDLTRSLVERRKRQMKGAEETRIGDDETNERQAKGTEETHEGVVPFEIRSSAVDEEKIKEGAEDETATDEELDAELAKLEAEARESGETASVEGDETASEEDEIEKAIAELEAIRASLRERKEKVHGASASGASGEESAGDSDSDEEESEEAGDSSTEASEVGEPSSSSEGADELQSEDSVSNDDEPEEPKAKKPARKVERQSKPAKKQPKAAAKPSKKPVAKWMARGKGKKK